MTLCASVLLRPRGRNKITRDPKFLRYSILSGRNVLEEFFKTAAPGVIKGVLNEFKVIIITRGRTEAPAFI